MQGAQGAQKVQAAHDVQAVQAVQAVRGVCTCTFIPAAAKARSWLRTHRLRQPLSVRPGSSLAMAFHVSPCIRTAMSMMLSSSGVHMSPFLLPAPR